MTIQNQVRLKQTQLINNSKSHPLPNQTMTRTTTGQIKTKTQTGGLANNQVLPISVELYIQFIKLVNLGLDGFMLWNTDRILYDSPHFKESLQVVNLSEGHGHQHQSLEEGPQHHPAVRVVID